MRRIATLTGVMAILLLLVTACKHRPATLQYQALPQEGWKATDTVSFEIDSLFTSGKYILCAKARTSASHPYPYRQFVVEVRQLWEPQHLVQVDTVEFKISASDGEIEGRGVTIFNYEMPTTALDLPVGAHARVEITHLMRRSPLPGISHIGFYLKPLH